MKNIILSMLCDLASVRQSRKHHPEGDALTHSLQVFDLAFANSDNPELWAAALLHDVGKIDGNLDHAERGADMIGHYVTWRVRWWVAHHMDLAYNPRRTRRKIRKNPWMRDLELLRRWDLAGRKPGKPTSSVYDAVDTICIHLGRLPTPYNDEQEYASR